MIGETDLGAEFVAARDALTPEHRKRLRGLTVPSIVLDVWGLIGVTKIDVEGDQFILDPHGREVFVVALRADPSAPADIDHPHPREAILLGDCVDLIAFDPDRPEWFATMTGAAPTLGFAMFGDKEPTQVWRGPLGWLQSKCQGIVPLTRDQVELRAILHRLPVGGIVAEDLEHGRQLRDLFARPRPAPSIFMPRLRTVAA